MADPNQSYFDNLYNALVVKPEFGSPGNNIFTLPSLESEFEISPSRAGFEQYFSPVQHIDPFVPYAMQMMDITCQP
jgi:hypothetical protein